MKIGKSTSKQADGKPSAYVTVNIEDWEHENNLRKQRGNGSPYHGIVYKFHNFHWYFKTAYLLGVIPYTFKIQTETQEYVLTRPPKIILPLHMSFWIFSIVGPLANFRYHFYMDPNLIHPTIYYFYFAHSFFCAVRRLVYYKILLEKFTQVGEMLKIIGRCSLLVPANGTRGASKIVLVTQVIWVLIAFTCAVVGFNLFPTWRWSPSLLFRSLVAQGKFTFFLAPSNSSLIDLPETESIRWDDIILAIGQFAATLTSEIQGYFVVVAFGTSSVTIWLAARNFKERIQKGAYKNLEVITEAFQELSRLSDSINRVWHVVFFALVLDAILWLATDLDRAFRTPDYFVKMHISYWLLYTGVSTVLSAEAARIVSSFFYYCNGTLK